MQVKKNFIIYGAAIDRLGLSHKKISCRQNEYRSTIEKIFTEENYLMVIDSCCFNDNDRHIVLQSDRKSLIDILTHFYWELDEIYISNSDLDWFIAVNHEFEMHFYCNENSAWLSYYCDRFKEKEQK